MNFFKIVLCFISLTTLGFTKPISLNIGILVVSGEHRSLLHEISLKFEKKNPGTKINWKEVSNEEYHKVVEKWVIGDKLDMISSFAGFRLKTFIKRGHVEPLNGIWGKSKFKKDFSNTFDSVSLNGIPYGLPISYYNWGFYYRKSLFKKLKITPPNTWSEILKTATLLKKNGISPFGIGTKDNWAVASWFSYFNLRMNGIKFHNRLMKGKESYQSEKVIIVLKMMADLFNNEYFNKDHSQLKWDGVLPFIYWNKSAMVLMGSFAFSKTPSKIKNDLGVFSFPVIDKNIPTFEEAPTDMFILKSNSKKKKLAKKFLKFFSTPEILFMYNEKLGTISPNMNSKESDVLRIKEGSEILKSAIGVTQFFDRDNPLEMGEQGFIIFGDFAKNGDYTQASKKLEALKNRLLKEGAWD